jgi:hypothetical protein
MSKTQGLIGIGLFLLCFGFHTGLGTTVFPQSSIDAEFYSAVGQRLLNGQGLTEPFIWNHLKPATTIVRPVDYWMPLGILLFAFSSFFGGEGGPLFLNHFLWSLLACAVFLETRRLTGKPLTALLGFFLCAFGGKFAYYVSTTDNIVFYAVLGFLFFRCLSWEADVTESSHQGIHLGFISGLMALTRIEGLFFGCLATAFCWQRGRRKTAGLVLLMLFLTISPWIIRNLKVLGTPWPSHVQALFLRSYDDLFDPQAAISWHTYISQGWSWVFRHKIQALSENVIEFFVIPGMVVLFPFWFIGVYHMRQSGGRLLLGSTLLFWFMNGALFTTQSLRGTAFHISAAFFPHLAVFTAIGIRDTIERVGQNRSFTFRTISLAVFLAYIVCFSLFATQVTRESYETKLRYYRRFFDWVTLSPSAQVVSNAPWFVHRFSGCGGVVHLSGPPSLAFDSAERFSCRYVLLDIRNYSPDLPWLTHPGWEQVTIRLPLILWRKANQSPTPDDSSP